MRFKLIWWFGIAEKEIEKRIPKYKRKAEDILKDVEEKELLNIIWSSDINEIAKFLVIKDIIDKYYNLWIKEFFIWYNPPYWHQKYWFEFSPNGRFWENEQITSYDTFEKAVKYVKNLWAEIFLTVNFRYYTDDTMPLIEKIINDAIEVGISWFIVWSPELLEYLASIWYKWKINISTILSLYNEDAIEFLIWYAKELNLNINRIILPREVTLKEIKYLTSKFTNLKFEVFGHWDYCRYANWLCLAEHKYFSRDICWFVIKHWLKIKRTILPYFKKIILDENLSDMEKQQVLDNALENDILGLNYIFTSQTVVWNNYKNPTLDEYIDFFKQNENNNNLTQLAQTLYIKMKQELNLNFYKFIRDGLRPPTDWHNLFIDKFLTLYELINKYIEKDDIKDKIAKIKKIRDKAKKYYYKQINNKWKFWLETLYKFMLYNRTSIPFYKFFNDIPNIEVVKIPLRGRDLSVFKLWLDLIEDAIKNPKKYVNEWNISWKYFHYDPSKLDFYKEVLEKDLISWN